MNETDEDTPEQGPISERFEPLDLACLALRWTANVTICIAEAVETTAGAINYLSNMAARHANYRRDRAKFAREVRDSIERLPGGKS